MTAIFNIHYDHLAKVLAEKHRKRLSGAPDTYKVGISSTPVYPPSPVIFDLKMALQNCILLSQKTDRV